MRRITLSCLLSAFPLLSGCLSHTPIEGSDYNVQSPLLRASFGVGDPGPRQLRIQATVAHQEGEFQDGIETGKSAQLNGIEFNGPTRLKGKMRMDLAHVGVVFPIPMHDGQFRWEPWAGGTAFNARLEVSDATASVTNEDSLSAAPSGGIAFIAYTPERHFGVRAALDATWASNTSFVEQEAVAFYAPTPNVELLLGYRYLEYKYGATGDSNVYTTLAGPAAGINVRF
jgi:hypothetical protein